MERKFNKGTYSEQDMRERELAATLYQAFQRSNDVMFYCDKSGSIQDINEAFTRHYGYTREEAIGQNPRILRSRHSSNELYKRMWESILDPKKGYWRGQMINKAKDGRDVPLILTISAVRNDEGEITGYISNALDMSEQTALQARLAQAEKLADIGEMTAIVAHEIRNPLGSIVMASKQLAGGELGSEDRAMVLQVLRSESQRLNEALENFLSFARPRHIKLAHQDLNALVTEICRFVESNKDLVGGINVRLSLDMGLKPFPMDPEQIRQVLWNIVLNAVQSMGNRGVLTVSTRRESGQSRLSVSDTGPGIPEKNRDSIFKPFFTSKGKGTGLGLAIADRIVKAHGGRIEIESSSGAGTTFSIYLPSIEE